MIGVFGGIGGDSNPKRNGFETFFGRGVNLQSGGGFKAICWDVFI